MSLSINGVWLPDPKAESVLEQLKISFASGPLTLAEIDWQATRHNAGRLCREIDPDRVQEYADSLESGDHFPMPIAVRLANNHTEILAGVHRTLAADQLHWKTIHAYWATVKLPHEARLIASLTNRKEGVRTSKEEAIAQALYIMQDCELKTSEVAKLFGLSKSLLVDHIRSQRIQKQAVEAGFKKSLPTRAFGNLTRLATNDKVLLAACEYLASVPNPSDTSELIVKPTLAHKTEAQQVSHLEQLLERHRKRTVVTATSPITLATRTKFLRAFHALDNIVGQRTLAELQIVPNSDEHKDLKKEWGTIRGKINHLFA